MDDDVRKSWERFLDPESLRSTLIIASIFITAYEMLEDSIVERIRTFFINGFNEDGYKVDPQYKEVLARHNSPIRASLDWLLEREAIDEDDLAIFKVIKDCRNELVHELPKFLSRGIQSDVANNFVEIVNLLKKIEHWWIVNFEIPINPDLHDKEIDYDGIISGPVLTLQLMMNIAFGDEEESRLYLEKFRELGKNN